MPNRLIKREEYADYLVPLLLKTFTKNPFDTICTVLRVSGLQDAKWDPFEESLDSFKDYNWLLKQAKEGPTQNCLWRVGLLMYCQAIEMTAPHEVLANIFRSLGGGKYHIKPLMHLNRKSKKDPFASIPPSATTKLNYLKKLAKNCGEEKFIELIDSFFNDKIRNAFSHSDYVITDSYFRWTEGGYPSQIKLDELDILISNAQEFYSAFWYCHLECLKNFSTNRKYHKWDNYEVLELLTKDGLLYGFNVHFSNGNKSTFSRTAEGVEFCNITIQRDGSIDFFVGLLNALKPIWMVDGKPYLE